MGYNLLINGVYWGYNPEKMVGIKKNKSFSYWVHIGNFSEAGC